MSRSHGLVLTVQVGGHLSVSTRPVGAVICHWAAEEGGNGAWQSHLGWWRPLQGTSLRYISNIVIFNVISAFPGDWTPRSPWVAREQFPQPRSSLLLLLPAVRAPRRQGHRAQLARRLMAPAGRCR